MASILPNVEFDGWSSGAFEQAVIDSGVDISLVHQIAPRGAIDLAVAFHKKGDELMMLGYKQENFTELKYSEKVMQLTKIYAFRLLILIKEQFEKVCHYLLCPKTLMKGVN